MADFSFALFRMYILVIFPIHFSLLFAAFLDGSTHLYMSECPSVGPSVGRSVRPSVTCYFQMLEMEKSLNENHWGRPTLTLLKVLNVQNVLKVLNVLNVLNMPI